MYAINPNDTETQNEIEMRQKKLTETIQAAIEAVNFNDKTLAITLLNEARHLSYYVGKGLRVKVQNEHSDIEMHRALTSTIDTLATA